jgi:hypothetical protein
LDGEFRNITLHSRLFHEDYPAKEKVLVTAVLSGLRTMRDVGDILTPRVPVSTMVRDPLKSYIGPYKPKRDLQFIVACTRNRIVTGDRGCLRSNLYK